MKKIVYLTLLFTLCLVFNPAFANDPDSPDIDEEDYAISEEKSSLRESHTRELKKQKKKKGKRNVTVQPSKEDDENIILELDGN
jgi:hypothetical protein